MNVTSNAAQLASPPRIGTSPHLIASSSEEGVAWDMTRLEGGDEVAWWGWLLAEVLVAAVVVVGDVSLLMLFFTRKLLGQSTNILVFSIAVADLTTGMLVLPLDVLQRVLSETSGYMCKSYFYFSNVSKTAVIYTITMLAMERIVAALYASFRVLTPGRCLFFSSLTWFFAAAYNIWSVVLYDTRILDFSPQPYSPGGGGGSRTEGDVSSGGASEEVLSRGAVSSEFTNGDEFVSGSGGGGGGGGVEGGGGGGAFMDLMSASSSLTSSSSSSSSSSSLSFIQNYSAHVCFSSTRFQRLVDIFVVLDFFVTFLLPLLASTLLFAVFWRMRRATRAPGRPYRSSTSVIIFTFALLVSFIVTHLPLEMVALHVHRNSAVRSDETYYDDVARKNDVRWPDSSDFFVYKVCQLVSFTRGFWDVFIFGVFRHYVCRKERALASFRDQYGGSDRGGAAGLGQGGGGGLGSGGGVAGGDGEVEVAVRRTACLAVPVMGPMPSTSLLDSDQEVTVTPHRSNSSDH